jgi:hypothetical protein
LPGNQGFGNNNYTAFKAEGPKPICVYPKDAGDHFNLDNVSVWLMSVENFHGSRFLLYNQQMDLHALVYHVTLLDVSARGFQVSTQILFYFETHRKHSVLATNCPCIFKSREADTEAATLVQKARQ